MRKWILFISCLMINNAFAQFFNNEIKCSDEDNFLIVNSREECIEKTARKNRNQSSFMTMVSNITECRNSFKDEYSPDLFHLPAPQIKNCDLITKCVEGEENSLNSIGDRQMYCSTKSLKEIYEQSKVFLAMDEVFDKAYKVDSIDSRLNELDGFLSSILDEKEIKDIKSCPRVAVNNNCFKDVPGLDAELIKSTIKSANNNRIANAVVDDRNDPEKLLNLINGALSETAEQESGIKYSFGINPQLTQQVLRSRIQLPLDSPIRRQGRLQTDSVDFDTPIQDTNETIRRIKAGNSFKELSKPIGVFNGSIYNEKLIKRKEEQLKRIKAAFKAQHLDVLIGFENLTLEDFQEANKAQKANKDDLNLAIKILANKIYEKNCESSHYDQNKYCSEVSAKIKNPAPLKKENYIPQISSFLLKYPGEFKNINRHLLANLNSISKVDYNQYLLQQDKFRMCVFNNQSTVKSKIFADQNALAAKKYLRSQQISLESSHQIITDKLEHSDNKDLVVLGREYHANKSFYSSNFDSNDINSSGLSAINKDRTAIQNQVADKSMPIDSNSVSTDSSSSFSKALGSAVSQSGNSNALSNRYDSNLNNSTYVPPSIPSAANNSESTQAIQKKLDELATKEKELKAKTVGKAEGAPESDEMKSLQKQIEELRAELASTRSTGSGNKTLDQNSGRVTASSPSSKVVSNPSSSGVQNGGSQASSEARSSDYIQSNRAKTDEGSSAGFSSSSAGGGISGGSFSGTSGAIGSSKAVSNTGSVRDSGSVSSKAYGLVLTKSGDATDDLTKIVDNPKEADIQILAEKTNGQPFLIKENGIFVQIKSEMGIDGKPIIIDGKRKLIKLKLSKEASQVFARDFNPIRDAKTIRDTVRLQDLNKTVQEARK